MSRPLRVFLCHASQDKPAVWKMYRYLKQRGIQPWLDQADLLPGQNWEVEIPKALFESDVILVCLSKNSVNKEGYVQKEITFALDKAMEKPEGTIFVIPVKLEECDVPSRLRLYQWVDYFRPDGRKRLLMGLDLRSTNLGEEVAPVMVENTRKRPSSEEIEKHRNEEIATRQKMERERADKATAEKLAREKSEKEATDKAEREKAEKDAAEKLAREKAEREKAERERIELGQVKQAEKERLEKLRPKPQEAPVVAKKSQSVGEPAPKINIRTLGIGGIVFACLLLAVFGGNSLLKTFNVTVSELTSTITPAPTPGIGSSMISEKDGMTLVYVPAGEFTMGSDVGSSAEQPVHQVFLDAYWIDKTEVTTSMYVKCVVDGECSLPSVNTRYFDPAYPNHPMVYVSWDQANKYCAWARRKLPNEAQWEKAARYTDGRLFPWGDNMPSINVINFNLNINDTTEVGSYPQGVSLYGALDMSGNVSEWISSLYLPYPYEEDDGRESILVDGSRVLRGGSWKSDSFEVRLTYREKADSITSIDEIGFRCAVDATP